MLQESDTLLDADVGNRNSNTLERLTNTNHLLLTQRQCHRANLLNKTHVVLKGLVDDALVGNRITVEMYACLSLAECQIAIETIGKEGRYRSNQFADGQQALVQSLIASQLILLQTFAPQTFLGQANIPVAQVIDNECLDSSAGTCRFIIV